MGIRPTPFLEKSMKLLRIYCLGLGLVMDIISKSYLPAVVFNCNIWAINLLKSDF